MILGTHLRYVVQMQLLHNLIGGDGVEIRRNAAIDGIEHEHRVPLLALGRVNGRENEIVLVEQRRAGKIARGVRRIERQLGEELLPRGIAHRNLLELDQIGGAQRGILMDALEVRLVPDPPRRELGGPTPAAFPEAGGPRQASPPTLPPPGTPAPHPPPPHAPPPPRPTPPP